MQQPEPWSARWTTRTSGGHNFSDKGAVYVSYSDGAGAAAHTSCEYREQAVDGADALVVSTGAAAVTPQGGDLPVSMHLRCTFRGGTGSAPIVRESSGAPALALAPWPHWRKYTAWEVCVAGRVEWSDGSNTDLPLTCLPARPWW